MTGPAERIAHLWERFEILSGRLRKIAVAYMGEILAAGHPVSAASCVDLAEEMLDRNLVRLKRITAHGSGGFDVEAIPGFMAELETAVLATDADLRRLEAAAAQVEAAVAGSRGRSRSLH